MLLTFHGPDVTATLFRPPCRCEARRGVVESGRPPHRLLRVRPTPPPKAGRPVLLSLLVAPSRPPKVFIAMNPTRHLSDLLIAPFKISIFDRESKRGVNVIFLKIIFKLFFKLLFSIKPVRAAN